MPSIVYSAHTLLHNNFKYHCKTASYILWNKFSVFEKLMSPSSKRSSSAFNCQLHVTENILYKVLTSLYSMYKRFMKDSFIKPYA